MIGLDPVAREGKGVERTAVAAGMGARDLVGGHPQTGLVEIKPVEGPGQLDQRMVAAGGNVGNDRPHGVFDIG